ncbi:zf-HC2 domain-containing protein [bacterium]|nr:zf-HC2 domain-containing protein [bacterium]
MSCKKFRVLSSAYLDQEITKDEEKKLLNHLKTCPDCARELEYLKQIKGIFLLKGKREPREFFETRLFERIKNKGKQPIRLAYFPVFKRSLVVILIFFSLILGWVSYKKFFYHRTTEITPDLLIGIESEENFEEEILQAYYAPPG